MTVTTITISIADPFRFESAMSPGEKKIGVSDPDSGVFRIRNSESGSGRDINYNKIIFFLQDYIFQFTSFVEKILYYFLMVLRNSMNTDPKHWNKRIASGIR